MCATCDSWKREAEREPSSGNDTFRLTSLTCPLCETKIVATERTANLVNAVGKDYWRRFGALDDAQT